MRLNELKKREYDPKQDPKVKELVSQYHNGLISLRELRDALSEFRLTYYDVQHVDV